MQRAKTSVSLHVEDVEGTSRVAEIVAKHIVGSTPACIELVGDVGAGKTTFTQQLVGFLGSGDQVSSPTFTLENVYQAGDNTVHHFDLYRLQDAGLLPEEVNEALQEKNSIVIIEWADILEESGLPEQRVIITFEPVRESESARKITVSAPQNSELIEVLAGSKTI